MIKSPLRYPGGKSRAINSISKLIPSFQEYREPFVGGGTVFIYLKQKFPEKNFWINDLYINLYLFWKVCLENPELMLQAILKFNSQFSDGKQLHQFLLKNINSFDDIEKAAAFFIFNRITFSGTTESGGFSNAAFHKRFTHSSIKRVEALSKILPNTKITNHDYEEVVLADGEGVFLFLDPPYFSATKSALYGKNGTLHKSFEHERFADVMSKCKHNWLITYDDNEFIKKLFSFANIKSWNLKYGMRNVNKNSDRTGKELFISNFSLEDFQQRELDLFTYAEAESLES